MTINRDLLPMKAHYFFFNAGTAPLVPFMTTYAKQLGFSPEVVGTVFTFLPIFGLLAKPLFGAIADRYQKHKIIFIIFQVITIVGFLGLYFIPEVTENTTKLTCGDSESFFKVCYDNDKTTGQCLTNAYATVSETSYCHMTCDITKPYMWEVICKQWKMPMFCLYNLPIISFTSIIHKEEIMKSDNCLKFRANHTRFSNGMVYTPKCTKAKFDTNCMVKCDDNRLNNLYNSSKKLDTYCMETGMQFSTCPQHDNNEKYEPAFENETGDLQCEVNCDRDDPWMLATLCEEWKAQDSNECTVLWQAKVLDFNAVVLPQKTILEDQCIFFKIQRIISTEGSIHYVSCPRVDKFQPHFETSCHTVCDNLKINDAIVTANSGKVNDQQFGLRLTFFSTFMVINWIGMAVVVSLADAICFAKLGDRASQYGRQRLWGSLGWGIFSLLTGYLIDLFSQDRETKNYLVAFVLMFLLMMCDILVSSIIKINQQNSSVNIFRNIGIMFSSYQFFHFFVWMILTGMCTGLIWQFLFWYLEDLAQDSECTHIDWIKTLQGLVSGIQCFGGELPFFFISGSILKRIGHLNSMSLVLLGFGLRFILYSLLTNPWWTLPIELFQGLTFGMLFTTMNSYANLIAPIGVKATVMGLTGAVFEGVGTSLGNLISGILFGKLGGAMTFRIFGVAALIGCLINVALTFSKVFQNYNNEDRQYTSIVQYGEMKEIVQILDQKEHQDKELICAEENVELNE